MGLHLDLYEEYLEEYGPINSDHHIDKNIELNQVRRDLETVVEKMSSYEQREDHR